MDAHPPRVPPRLEQIAGYAWRLLIIAGALTVSGFVFLELSLVFVPIIVALLGTTLLDPPARWLRDRGLPDGLAAFLLVAGSVSVVVTIAVLLAPQIAEELSGFAEGLGEEADDAVQWAIEGPVPVDARQMRQLITRAGQQIGENAGPVLAGVFAGARVIVDVVVGLLIAIVLIFFLLKDGDLLSAWLLARVPPERREEVAAVSRRAWTALGGYLRGVALVALVDAVGIGLGIWVIGLPLVMPLALLTFVGGFFPIIGAVVAGLVAVLVALVSLGPFEAFLTLLVVLAVQQLESNVLEPVIVGHAVRLHPVVVIIALTAGAVLGGILGAFLAVPTSAVVSAIGNELRLRREAAELVARTQAATG